MDLYHLIYQSQALGDFGAPALAALLHRGRAHNQAHGISGVLLHTADGRFLQVLEGPKTAVRHLYYHVILSDGLGLAHRPYPRPQLLAQLEAFVAQGPAETGAGPAYPLDSRPTRHF